MSSRARLESSSTSKNCVYASRESPGESAIDQISSRSALVAKIKLIFRDRNTSFYGYFDQQPLKIHNGLFHFYCISMYEIIHQNKKD